MSIFGAIGHGLSGLFGFGDEQAAADESQQKLRDAIAAGGLQASAQYGQAGVGLHNKADGLLKSGVALDYSKPNADDARLAAVRDHYLSQFQNGGLAGQAAVGAAQNARGLQAQGGVAGIRADTIRSDDSQAQVAGIAQNEIGQAGDATNALDHQKAAIALKRAVLQAQVTHSNFQKNLAAQGVNFDLTNSQQQLANLAQGESNQLSNNERDTSLNYDQSQFELGKQLTDFLASAASSAVSAGTYFANAGAAAPAATGVVAAAPAATVAPIGEFGAGYLQPAATLGRSAVPNAVPYQPIFSTQPTLPNTASFFNRKG